MNKVEVQFDLAKKMYGDSNVSVHDRLNGNIGKTVYIHNGTGIFDILEVGAEGKPTMQANARMMEILVFLSISKTNFWSDFVKENIGKLSFPEMILEEMSKSVF